MQNAPTQRDRADLCPGVLRPWPAEDGLLVRIRLAGGQLSGPQLDALLVVAETFGDGDVHLTSRANLQVRGLGTVPTVPERVIEAFEATGLLPSRSHELVRNIMMSPQTGHGGRADLRPVVTELDRLLLADPVLGDLPGRFLFVLDDGRGDLIDRQADLGLVALDLHHGQLRIGDDWGPTVALSSAGPAIADLARDFIAARGEGPSAAWHVRELQRPLAALDEPDPGLPPASGPLPYGPVLGGVHREAVGGVLTRAAAADLLSHPTLVATPWRGIFVPDLVEQP